MYKPLLKNISPLYNNVNIYDARTRAIDYIIGEGYVIESQNEYEVIFKEDPAHPVKKGFRERMKCTRDISNIMKYFSLGVVNDNKLYMRTKRV